MRRTPDNHRAEPARETSVAAAEAPGGPLQLPVPASRRPTGRPSRGERCPERVDHLLAPALLRASVEEVLEDEAAHQGVGRELDVQIGADFAAFDAALEREYD